MATESPPPSPTNSLQKFIQQYKIDRANDREHLDTYFETMTQATNAQISNLVNAIHTLTAQLPSQSMPSAPGQLVVPTGGTLPVQTNPTITGGTTATTMKAATIHHDFFSDHSGSLPPPFSLSRGVPRLHDFISQNPPLILDSKIQPQSTVAPSFPDPTGHPTPSVADFNSFQISHALTEVPPSFPVTGNQHTPPSPANPYFRHGFPDPTGFPERSPATTVQIFKSSPVNHHSSFSLSNHHHWLRDPDPPPYGRSPNRDLHGRLSPDPPPRSRERVSFQDHLFSRSPDPPYQRHVRDLQSSECSNEVYDHHGRLPDPSSNS